MTFQKIVLPSEEEIVRLTARAPSTKGKTYRIRPSDFDRRMDTMSGISMFRAATKISARNDWTSSYLKGILIAKAGPVQALGLYFYDTGNNHFSVRCSGCDLSRKQFDQRPLCDKSGSICDFNPAKITELQPGQPAPLGIRDQLALIFKVDTITY